MKKIENTNNTKLTTTKKSNSTKHNEILSMNDIITLAHEYGICFYATNNTSTQYRIFNGKSSLNIKKSCYILYATTTDFDNIENAKLNDVTCERDKNRIDGKRPHKVTFKPNAIDDIFKVLALNTLNKMQ